jgi:hypothetical protein
MDWHRLLETIARGTAETMDGFCAISLLSPDRAVLQPVAFYDRDPEVRAVFARFTAASAFAVDSPATLANRRSRSASPVRCTCRFVREERPRSACDRAS